MRNTTRTRVRTSASATSSTPVEDELARLQARLDQLKAEVRQAQALASLGTAATMIAHEFANFLTPIKGHATGALESGDMQSMKRALTVAASNVDVIAKYCDRILNISAASPRVAERVAVREAVDAAVIAMCRDFAKDGIRFVNQVDDSIACLADRAELRQVLFNLLINARAVLKTTKGRLVVSAERVNVDVQSNGPERVRITVRDTGPGIAPELLPHIFEPFETSKRASSNGEARCGGLGLAICRDLVHQNAGTITVESELGVGTKFHIDLPAAQDSPSPTGA